MESRGQVSSNRSKSDRWILGIIKTHDNMSCGQVQLVRARDRQVSILQETRKRHFHASVA